MILLFGQHPQRAMAARQVPLHGRVGSVADLAPAPPSGGSWGKFVLPSYIRRPDIVLTPPLPDEDLILALATFFLLETDNRS
jgi:hypothetical protein